MFLDMVRDPAELPMELPRGYLEAFASDATKKRQIVEFAGGALLHVRPTPVRHLPLKFIDHDLSELLADEGASAREIIALAADQTDFSPETITGRDRKKPIVHVRHAAMFAIRALTDLSYPAIGREFGDRDHSTVIYGVEKAKGRVQGGHATTISILEGVCPGLSTVDPDAKNLAGSDTSSLILNRSVTLLGSPGGVLVTSTMSPSEIDDLDLHDADPEHPLYRLHGIVDPRTEGSFYKDATAYFAGEQTTSLLAAVSSSGQSA